MSEEGLSRFQSGSLLEKDEEWHRLVPPEAQEALGKQEVQRQSVIFEVFKSERDYVFDLEAVKDVSSSSLYHDWHLTPSRSTLSLSGVQIPQSSHQISFPRSSMRSSVTLIRYLRTTNVCWGPYSRGRESSIRFCRV